MTARSHSRNRAQARRRIAHHRAARLQAAPPVEDVRTPHQLAGDLVRRGMASRAVLGSGWFQSARTRTPADESEATP